MRLLHLADVHLGASFASFGPLADRRRQELLEAFRALPDVAQAEGVHAVLVAGDLFDGPQPGEYVVSLVRQTIRRLVDAGRPVVIVPGHYDPLYANPLLWKESLVPATVVLQPAFAEAVLVQTGAGPLRVRGVAYDWGLRPDPLTTYAPDRRPGVTEVVLLHGAVPASPQWALSPAALRLPLEWLLTLEADYVALGGLHEYRAPFDFDIATRINACYPGSFAAMDLTELGPRGFVVAEVEAGRAPRLQRHETALASVRDLGRLDVTDLSDDEQVAQAIIRETPAGTIPVVTLFGRPSFPLDPDRILSLVQPDVDHAGITDETMAAGSDGFDALAREDTVAGHLVRLGRERLEDAREAPSRLAAEQALRLALRTLRANR
jgi:exonuclease SbcD